MTKLVIIKFNGDLESGFQVNLEIGYEGQSPIRGCMSKLPPAPELAGCLLQWQQQYQQLDRNHRIKPQKIIYDGFDYPQKQLVETANQLKQKLQQWLNSHSFNNVDRYLREELQRQEKIRILICSDRPQLYLLPWCCWDIVENYPQLEIAVSNFNFERVPTAIKIPNGKVSILAIFGNNRGINLEAERNFLASLEDGEVIFLVEPSPQELYAALWQQSWDIVFFAGHSQTIARQGILSLNATDDLTIEQLRHGFKQAISSGLQLAIFNSCDGLGLAEELGKLSLPQSIVMRLPIPDVMAQQFLKYFLQAYASRDSLYLAMRQAREQLQGWEQQFPCASWLPTIYQNPAVIPPNWQELRGEEQSSLPLRKKPLIDRDKITSVILAAAISTILVSLIQSWGWLETLELKAYDRFVTWRTTPPADEKVLVVTIEDEDIQYQTERGMGMNMRGSLADDALEELLKKLQPMQPKAIASDVIHDFPFTPSLADTIAQNNFFAICRIHAQQAKLVGIAPPPLPTEQLGFSNLPIDNDGAIRRQILGMAADDVCQSQISLSLRLALEYLDNPIARRDSQGVFKIGDVFFPRLQAKSGGYHLPEAQGYQILLNYRRALPQAIALRDILTSDDPALELLVKDKIVLLGVLGHNQDLHYTPYSQGKQAKRLPGVMIHAQAISHITDVALGKQKLLWWLPEQIELIWIGIWAIVGSTLIAWKRPYPSKIFRSIVLALLLIFAACWLLFLNGGWLIAIAPALALLLSAGIKLIGDRYS